MRALLYGAVLLILIGCAAPVSTPTLVGTPTSAVQSTPITPTAVMTTPVVTGSRVVTFTTADGATLHGMLYGSGTTAIIFSTMGAQKQDTWTKMAQAAANVGYLSLTYNFRFWVSETRAQDNLRARVADDLRAAIAFVREQGAQQIVLAGASLGGMATAKVGGEAQAAAVIIMASPLSAKGLTVRVEENELQALTMPKLFISADHDVVVAPADARRMYDQSPEPKEIYLYPGMAHGTDLFETEHAADLIQRLLAFIQQHAPAK